MSLRDYFENVSGLGIMSTAGADGRVDSAVYAKPHFPDSESDNVVAFIMANHLSHANVVANPHAHYLYFENAPGYQGKRLALTKIAEETDPEKINAMRRRSTPAFCGDGTNEFLVTFKVENIRPLIGDEE